MDAQARASVAQFEQTVLDTGLRRLQDQERRALRQTTTATALAALYNALGGGWENLLPRN